MKSKVRFSLFLVLIVLLCGAWFGTARHFLKLDQEEKVQQLAVTATDVSHHLNRLFSQATRQVYNDSFLQAHQLIRGLEMRRMGEPAARFKADLMLDLFRAPHDYLVGVAVAQIPTHQVPVKLLRTSINPRFASRLRSEKDLWDKVGRQMVFREVSSQRFVIEPIKTFEGDAFVFGFPMKIRGDQPAILLSIIWAQDFYQRVGRTSFRQGKEFASFVLDDSGRVVLNNLGQASERLPEKLKEISDHIKSRDLLEGTLQTQGVYGGYSLLEPYHLSFVTTANEPRTLALTPKQILRYAALSLILFFAGLLCVLVVPHAAPAVKSQTRSALGFTQTAPLITKDAKSMWAAMLSHVHLLRGHPLFSREPLMKRSLDFIEQQVQTHYSVQARTSQPQAPLEVIQKIKQPAEKPKSFVRQLAQLPKMRRLSALNYSDLKAFLPSKVNQSRKTAVVSSQPPAPPRKPLVGFQRVMFRAGVASGSRTQVLNPRRLYKAD